MSRSDRQKHARADAYDTQPATQVHSLVKDEACSESVNYEAKPGCRHCDAERDQCQQRKQREECRGVAQPTQDHFSPGKDELNYTKEAGGPNIAQFLLV